MHPGSVATVAAVAGLFVLSGILFAPAGRRPAWMGIPLLVWIVVLVLIMLSTRVRGQTIAFVDPALCSFSSVLRSRGLSPLVPVSLCWQRAVFLSYSVSPTEVLLAGEGSGNPLLRFAVPRTDGERIDYAEQQDGPVADRCIARDREHPLIGHGYVSSRAVLLQEIPWAAYAHNAWYQVLLDLGIVGLGVDHDLDPVTPSCHA